MTGKSKVRIPARVLAYITGSPDWQAWLHQSGTVLTGDMRLFHVLADTPAKADGALQPELDLDQRATLHWWADRLANSTTDRADVRSARSVVRAVEALHLTSDRVVRSEPATLSAEGRHHSQTGPPMSIRGRVVA